MCVPHRRASALPCVTCVRALPTCCGPGGSRAQVLIGGPFYRSAWLGLRHKAANMALLVVIGTTAALVYSIISVVGLCAVCVCVCVCVYARAYVCVHVSVHTRYPSASLQECVWGTGHMHGHYMRRPWSAPNIVLANLNASVAHRRSCQC